MRSFHSRAVTHADRYLGKGGEREAHIQVRPDEIKACLLGLLPEPHRFVAKKCITERLKTSQRQGL